MWACDLLGGDDGHHPEATFSFGRLKIGADVVELAVVPAGAVGSLQLEEGDVVVFGEGRNILPEAVADLLEQRR